MNLFDEENLSYEKLKYIYEKYFSLGNLNVDGNNKLALISLICYLTEKLKSKSPNVTHYKVIYKIASKKLPDDIIERLAIICEDFSYNTKQFPNFGVEDKKIPEKIEEILLTWTPF